MKRARYRCTETGEIVDVLVAQPDACGVYDISTLPPRPAPRMSPPDQRPPRPWVGVNFWVQQRAAADHLRYGGC